MLECNQKTPLCQCIDWKTGDLAVGVNHLMNHFEFQRFELEYSTLEPEEKAQEISVVRPQIQGSQVVPQAAAHPGMPDLWLCR